jgi:hypothetical protein
MRGMGKLQSIFARSNVYLSVRDDLKVPNTAIEKTPNNLETHTPKD